MENNKFWEDIKSGHFATMVRETSKGQTLSNSREVYNVIKPLTAGHDDVEAIYGIFLNAANEVAAIEKLFSGTLSHSSVYPREVIKRVLDLKACAVVLAHNHPSGQTKPSREDNTVTFKLAVAFAAMDVRFLDHIIVGNGFYSMADDGVMAKIKLRANQLLSMLE